MLALPLLGISIRDTWADTWAEYWPVVAATMMRGARGDACVAVAGVVMGGARADACVAVARVVMGARGLTLAFPLLGW